MPDRLPTDLRAILDRDQIEKQMLEHLTWVVETRERSRAAQMHGITGLASGSSKNYVNSSVEYEKADRATAKRIDDHLREARSDGRSDYRKSQRRTSTTCSNKFPPTPASIVIFEECTN